MTGRLVPSLLAVLLLVGVTATAVLAVGAPPGSAQTPADPSDPAPVDTALQGALGDAFAGTWLEGDRLVVGITDPGRADAARALGAEPRPVAHSAARLDAAKDALDRRFTPGAVPDGIASWGVDPVTNSVVLSVVDGDAQAQATAEAAAAADPTVRIEHVAQAPRPYFDLIGGQRIILNGIGGCSSGFNAHDRPGNRFLLTAGHCMVEAAAIPGSGDGPVEVRSDRSGPIGVEDGFSYPTDDYARIKVTSASAAPTALVDRHDAGSDVTVMGSTRTPAQGQVCKSGKSTGWTCGAVAGFDRTVNYGGSQIVRGLTSTSICAEPGDSGGAVVSHPGQGTEVQAQGMVSGGYGGCSTGGNTFFQPVGEALNAYGLSLYNGGPNAAPVGTDDTYLTRPDTELTVAAPGVLSNDFDPDADPLTATLVTPPSSPAGFGFFFAFDGVFSYTPAPGFTGTDSFTYRVSDGEATDTATVTITVGAGGQAPTAVEDSYTTSEDTDLNVDPPQGVLANDTDPEGDPLTATVATGPEHGRLILAPNGGLLYDPDPGFNGPDQFTYTASDGVTTSEPGTVLLAVTAVDSPPVGTPEFFSTVEDQPLSVDAPGLLANDSDPDGDPLTVVLLADVAHGTLTLADDGGFSYVPVPDYHGPDQFTYAAQGAAVLSGPVTVPLLVVPFDDPPAAVPDAFTTVEDTTLTGTSVLANDTDADGDALTAAVADPPRHGSLTLAADGTFTYTPAPDFTGTDAFTYVATGRSSSSPPTPVTITVEPAPNTAPVTTPDTYTTVQNTPLTVPAPGVLGNDTDADGNPLTAALGTGPSSGTVTLNADGSFTYRPNIGFVGTDTFTYTAKDGTATSTPATVTFTVTAATCASVPPGSIVGTAGNNVLTGIAGDDLIYGLGGNDAINGNGGNDLICGGPGNDTMAGGEGNDRMFGEAGNDTVNGDGGDDALSGGEGNDAVNGGVGTNTVDGGPGNDACRNPTTGPGCP